MNKSFFVLLVFVVVVFLILFIYSFIVFFLFSGLMIKITGKNIFCQNLL